MNVVAPKCPTCGADVDVAAGARTARCKFCNKDVLLDGNEALGTVAANLVALARAATEAGNGDEANALWSRVLEQDPANSEAWLGKAKAMSMTLATMLRSYEQAEFYCRRALEASRDRKAAESDAFAILAEHLDTMTTAAKAHFDEFWEVDGAGQEHLGYVLAILDGYDRLAELTSTKMAHKLAVDLCDGMIASRIFGAVPAIKQELQGRRRVHIEKGGAVLASTQAKDSADAARAARRLKSGRIALGVMATAAVILSIAGWGRWAGSSPPAAATGPAAPPSANAPPSVATYASPSTPPASAGTTAGSGTTPVGLPQTVSFLGDSTWALLDVADRGQTLAAVKGGKSPQRTPGRWIVVHFEATNDAATTANSPPDPRIIDARGRSIELWSEDSYDNYVRGAARVLGTEDVKPGIKRDYWAIFEVPAGAQPTKVRLHAMQGKGIRDVGIPFPGDRPREHP